MFWGRLRRDDNFFLFSHKWKQQFKESPMEKIWNIQNFSKFAASDQILSQYHSSMSLLKRRSQTKTKRLFNTKKNVIYHIFKTY